MFRKLRAEAERENGKENKLMFDNRALFALLLPIIIEQILNSFMGMVDTVMVSNVGSAAISAVSLVDSINNLVIQVFSEKCTDFLLTVKWTPPGSLPSPTPLSSEPCSVMQARGSCSLSEDCSCINGNISILPESSAAPA